MIFCLQPIVMVTLMIFCLQPIVMVTLMIFCLQSIIVMVIPKRAKSLRSLQLELQKTTLSVYHSDCYLNSRLHSFHIHNFMIWSKTCLSTLAYEVGDITYAITGRNHPILHLHIYARPDSMTSSWQRTYFKLCR